jgi:hypothetical protein
VACEAQDTDGRQWFPEPSKSCLTPTRSQDMINLEAIPTTDSRAAEQQRLAQAHSVASRARPEEGPCTKMKSHLKSCSIDSLGEEAWDSVRATRTVTEPFPELTGHRRWIWRSSVRFQHGRWAWLHRPSDGRQQAARETPRRFGASAVWLCCSDSTFAPTPPLCSTAVVIILHWVDALWATIPLPSSTPAHNATSDSSI